MTPQTFENRLSFIKDQGYPVVGLGEAVENLENHNLPSNAVAITIDDGWYGTFKHQYPALRQHGFPSTLYIASYYMEKQTQVFNVALSYVVWKSGVQAIDFSALGFPNIGSATSTDDAADSLCKIANSMEGSAERQKLFRKTCETIDADWKQIESDRLISFMTAAETAEIAANGVDIQLHTHRHVFPDDSEQMASQEIIDNRSSLNDIARTRLDHFCYPSGVYSANSVKFLERLDMKTATTTNPGFNRPGAHPLELKRFLDSESVSELEFEAELSGFFELIRRTGYKI